MCGGSGARAAHRLQQRRADQFVRNGHGPQVIGGTRGEWITWLVRLTRASTSEALADVAVDEVSRLAVGRRGRRGCRIGQLVHDDGRVGGGPRTGGGRSRADEAGTAGRFDGRSPGATPSGCPPVDTTTRTSSLSPARIVGSTSSAKSPLHAIVPWLTWTTGRLPSTRPTTPAAPTRSGTGGRGGPTKLAGVGQRAARVLEAGNGQLSSRSASNGVSNAPTPFGADPIAARRPRRPPRG